jgi:hypothetical protein
MITLNEWSWVAATGNISSMFLVGPMLVVLNLRYLGWSRVRLLVVALAGWCALFVAQMVMWQVFGFQAGYPGFKYLQWLALPISFGNFLASFWLTKQSRRNNEREPA